ncbi:hypothetical protein QBC46DRAFT_373171 [Diplogelasinospora grovesii]|uniref:Uncharacterized protein n=1 Tax=Diplogelasinospora grovesii TaxID=303347 RepID=A0AAN6NFE0_9PEZI|nr:hypothetical protein QBC46DRAFT_373171 [Diplogelasinospora grovesii]
MVKPDSKRRLRPPPQRHHNPARPQQLHAQCNQVYDQHSRCFPSSTRGFQPRRELALLLLLLLPPFLLSLLPVFHFFFFFFFLLSRGYRLSRLHTRNKRHRQPPPHHRKDTSRPKRRPQGELADIRVETVLPPSGYHRISEVYDDDNPEPGIAEALADAPVDMSDDAVSSWLLLLLLGGGVIILHHCFGYDTFCHMLPSSLRPLRSSPTILTDKLAGNNCYVHFQTLAAKFGVLLLAVIFAL